MDTEKAENLKTLSNIFIDLSKQFSGEVFGMGLTWTLAFYLCAMAEDAKRQGRDENMVYEEGIDYLKTIIGILKKWGESMDCKEKQESEVQDLTKKECEHGY